MNEIENLRVAYEKPGASGIRNSVQCIASAVLGLVVPLPKNVTPSPKVPQFSDAYDINAMPVSSKNKPWMFVFPLGFELTGELVWNITDRRKR